MTEMRKREIKRILALLGALTLGITARVSVVGCSATNKMTPQEVEDAIYKVASEKDLIYEGPYLFDSSDNGPERNVFSEYAYD